MVSGQQATRSALQSDCMLGLRAGIMRHIIPFFLITLVATQNEDPARLAQRARDLVLQRHQQGEAENLVRKAISLWNETGERKGPEYARALTLLGMLEEIQLMQNEPELEAQVQPLYEKAIDILERAPGASSADLALALELDANVLILLKRADAAIQPFGRAKAMRSRRIADMQEATVPVSTTPYRIGGRTGAPHLVSKVEPEYSEEARLLKYQGTVVLSVVVERLRPRWPRTTLTHARELAT
jgi:hypothetical protein